MSKFWPKFWFYRETDTISTLYCIFNFSNYRTKFISPYEIVKCEQQMLSEIVKYCQLLSLSRLLMSIRTVRRLDWDDADFFPSPDALSVVALPSLHLISLAWRQCHHFFSFALLSRKRVRFTTLRTNSFLLLKITCLMHYILKVATVICLYFMIEKQIPINWLIYHF